MKPNRLRRIRRLVFDGVVPALREHGVMDDDVFRTIFVENPARWLTA